MERRLPMTLIALTGVIGPLAFIALVIAQGLMHPDYSHVAMPVSALTAWPGGWLQKVNFAIAGTLMATFVLGLHATIRPTRFGLLGIALLLASSVGVVMAGLFPWIRVDGVPTETPAHAAAAILTFLGASIGLIALSRRLAADPEWHDLAAYVLATGIIMLMMFVVLGGFAIEAGTPLHQWAGLLQRVLVVIWFACILVMARRVMRIGRETASPSPLPAASERAG